MIENALRSLVKQYANVGEAVMPSTEIGNANVGLPKIAYTRISGPRALTDSGPTKLVTARYQLDVFTATMTQGRTIIDALRSALHGLKPPATDNTRIDLIRFDDDSFNGTTPAAGANTAAARFQQDVFITYRE